MTEMQPQMEPDDVQGTMMSGNNETVMPTGVPPENIASGTDDTTDIGEPLPISVNAHDTAPSLLPEEGTGSGISAWQNNKRITGLWSINQNRNSWVHINGVGWKKLANNSDSAIVALTMLGSHAREKGSVVNYREEKNMIHEMYIW